jgi:hypothetical protein
MINLIIDESGYQCWYNKTRKLHRTDGPAIIRADKSQYWSINGNFYFNNKSFQKAVKLSDGDMTAIVLKYGDI